MFLSVGEKRQYSKTTSSLALNLCLRMSLHHRGCIQREIWGTVPYMLELTTTSLYLIVDSEVQRLFKEKLGVWVPILKLTITSPDLIVDFEVQLSTPTMIGLLLCSMDIMQPLAWDDFNPTSYLTLKGQ
jgi:hypothetical protein